MLGCKSQDEFFDDKREEIIYGMINGYAGGLGLTTAHEVGHLASLGHVDDDPVGIMNVKEGAGLHYLKAHFAESSMTILKRTLGIVANKKKRQR